jgi:hypothetical protein
VYGEWEETRREVVIVYFMALLLPLLGCTVLIYSGTAISQNSENPKSRITVSIDIEENNVLGFNTLQCRELTFWRSPYLRGQSVSRTRDQQ